MQLRIMTEPQQGATYSTLLAVARAAEDAGFDGFFRSDHLVPDRALPVAGRHGLPGPTEAWVTLAGLARETSRLRIGTLMTAATFRHPGLLAIEAAGLDEMSGGRLELGIGTGWFEQEHSAQGIPFPSLGERFDRLDEQLQILTGLWTTPADKLFSFTGKHYRLVDSPALPKPAQTPHPPIIIGGTGHRRTPALAARYAAEFNVPFADLHMAHLQFERVRAACEPAGRDASAIRLSVALPVCCARTERVLTRRAAALGRDLAALRAWGVAGTPAEVIDKLGRYAEIGTDRVYLHLLDLSDLEQIDELGAEVLPAVAAL
jgi:F420-dependent oxidoreductase-like protein